MFPDYKNLILEDYHRKKEQNKLPLSLVILSPAKLRDECLKICDERYNSRDLRTLKDFFGVGNGKLEFLTLIDKVDVDKLKPLIRFLNGETASTDKKNIELLAWMIDFQPRPFELGRKYGNMEEGGMEEGEKEEGRIEVDTKETGDGKQETGEKGGMEEGRMETAGLVPRKKAGLLKWLIPGAIAVVSITGFSIMKFREKPPAIHTFIDPTASCMYWTGEKYKAVNCNSRVGAATVIALDTFQLNNFKRVLQIDTITLKSTGKLWYLKRNKSLEIFTAPGNHPKELNKQLKPLSAYMIKKYILKNEK